MKGIKLLSGVILCALLLLTASCQKENEKPDPCKGVSCLNGGYCTSGSCTCAPFYEGSNCGTEVRQKFYGNYNCSVFTLSNGTTEQVVTNISYNSAGPDYLTLDGIKIKLTNNIGAFTIPYQSLMDVTEVYYASGSGSFSSGGAISANLTIEYSNGDVEAYTYLGTK